MDNARYDLENGPEIVRLNFTHTILSDSGIWRCEVIVESEHYGVSNGRLSPLDSSVIGQPVVVDIQLTIIGRFWYKYTVCTCTVCICFLNVYLVSSKWRDGCDANTYIHFTCHLTQCL